LKTRLIIVLLFVTWALALHGQAPVIDGYEPGEGLVFSHKDDYKIRFTGFLQPMVENRYYPEVAERKNYLRFRMRRLVTRMSGDAGGGKFNYQLQVDLTGSGDAGGDGAGRNYLMDAWVSWKPNKSIEIILGQDNSPTDSREMGMLSNALQLVERSPVALAFASIREFGMFIHTRVPVGEKSVLLPSFALTNGDGANVREKDRGGLKIGGRLDFQPFGNFANRGRFRQADVERELTPKLIFGANYSYNHGISDRRGRVSGSILYLDSAGNELLPNYTKYGVDFLFKYKGFSMLGEYINANVSVPGAIYQRVRNDGSTTPSFLVNDVQDVESYVKGRIIVGSGFNLQAGYLFLNGISVDGRYAKFMPQTHSFLWNPTFYNRNSFYTLCVSKYFGRHYGAKLQASVSYNVAEKGTLTVGATPLIGNEITGLLMLTFAL